MKITLVRSMSRSAVFELVNDSCYRAPAPYTVTLDGAAVCSGDTNVFSLYSLEPAHTYTLAVTLDGVTDTLTFTTAEESFFVNASRYGLVADGATDNTAKLQAALSTCPAGGTVYVPAGTYRTQSLFLQSSTTLYLEKGCTLLGGTDRRDYPILPGVLPCHNEKDEKYLALWEGNPLDSFAALINVINAENVTITGNNSTFEGGGIYGKGAITLTDATVTGNNQYDVYYGGGESSAPKLTVSGSVKAGYYANYAWKLPILVSGALREDSVIRVGVREGINLGAIAEPASGVTLSAENFKADAADSVTSLGEGGKVYLSLCDHEMDDTGYTCKKCHTQFDARIGESAYYQTLTKAFDAARGNTVTLLRDVTLTGNCSAAYNSTATLDLNGKTVSSERYYISVGGGNKPRTLTVKDSGTGGGTQALDVTFYVSSNGTLAVGDSYTGKISRVELQAGGALERFGGKIGELALSNAAGGSKIGRASCRERV